MNIEPGKRILLKNGTIIDGSGARAFTGDVLIENDTIADTGNFEPPQNCLTIDCSGKIVSPGFIDSHSHMDWFLAAGNPAFTSPFIAQGITTFVTGNCGYGMAGFVQDTSYRDLITNNLFKGGDCGKFWSKMKDYFDDLEHGGIACNIVNLAGHGTTRTSIRGFKPGPLDKKETDQLIGLLGDALDEGAQGVSFGLTYEPGIFADNDEILTVAKLVQKKGKIVTVHGRAYSAIAPTYSPNPFGKPHNLRALEEMVSIARKSNVSLTYSHLIFAGKKSWKTVDRALEIIENARAEGLDFMSDIFAQTGGPTQINALFPPWFLSKVPDAYHDRLALVRLKMELNLIMAFLGFTYNNVTVNFSGHPDLEWMHGLTISEAAVRSGKDPFSIFIELSESSGGAARIFNSCYLNEEIIQILLKHPAFLYMTDAWYEPEGMQNPALSGGFPKILQTVRDNDLLSKEQVLHKMTGLAARRYNLKNRGVLKRGNAADITIFDWEKIRDNTTRSETDLPPDGIHYVFINGKMVYENGTANSAIRAGRVIRV